MLHFAGMDAPALPVHDSFIVHHGYAEAGEAEEAMRRAFHETFGESIKVSQEIIDWHYRKTQSDTVEIKPLFDQILQAMMMYHTGGTGTMSGTRNALKCEVEPKGNICKVQAEPCIAADMLI